MYQAPRPISSAPTVTAFTPSATPLHVAAVPVSLPSAAYHHRPIAGVMSRGGVAATLASARSGAPAPAAQFVQRIQPPAGFGGAGTTATAAAGGDAGAVPAASASTGPSWSPAASPSAASVSQIHASVFGPVSTPSPEPNQGSGAPAAGGSGAGGAAAVAGINTNASPSLAPSTSPVVVSVTPVAGPTVSFAFQPAYTPRVDLYTPQSPMMSPLLSPLLSPQSEYTPGGGNLVRRDSVDETASANAHLHNILWRNAQTQLRSATTLRHGSQAHTHAIGTPGSAGTRALLSPKSSSIEQTGAATPQASPSLAPANHNGTRAIPISKPRVTPNQLSALQSSTEDGGSREGSRRGSTSAHPSSSLLSTSVTHPSGSFLGSSSPLGSSLSTSFTVLSHTPPTRAVNPQQHDQCFSPATQAGHFRDLHAANAIPPLLPMLHSGATSPVLGAQQSPGLRASALAQSLAQRQLQQQSPPMSGIARSVFTRGAVHVHAGSPATANPTVLPAPLQSRSPKLDEDAEAHPNSCPC